MECEFGKFVVAANLVVAAALLSACQSSQTSIPPNSAIGSSVAPESLVGRWGLASYHNDADRVRTETAARAQCNNPYVIAMGQSGGVVMHLADEPQPQELVLKGAPGGKTFLGPAGEPGGQADREIVSIDSNEFVTRWVNPETAGRYGTMIYARCKA